MYPCPAIWRANLATGPVTGRVSGPADGPAAPWRGLTLVDLAEEDDAGETPGGPIQRRCSGRSEDLGLLTRWGTAGRQGGRGRSLSDGGGREQPHLRTEERDDCTHGAPHAVGRGLHVRVALLDQHGAWSLGSWLCYLGKRSIEDLLRTARDAPATQLDGFCNAGLSKDGGAPEGTPLLYASDGKSRMSQHDGSRVHDLLGLTIIYLSSQTR
jgi:hypothetical protein